MNEGAALASAANDRYRLGAFHQELIYLEILARPLHHKLDIYACKMERKIIRSRDMLAEITQSVTHMVMGFIALAGCVKRNKCPHRGTFMPRDHEAFVSCAVDIGRRSAHELMEETRTVFRPKCRRS